MKTITVKKEDIKKIGDTVFAEDGLTVFELDVHNDAFWIEEIFLRNILEDISEDYKILSVDDFQTDDDGNVISLVFRTNLPWEEYLNYR